MAKKEKEDSKLNRHKAMAMGKEIKVMKKGGKAESDCMKKGGKAKKK